MQPSSVDSSYEEADQNNYLMNGSEEFQLLGSIHSNVTQASASVWHQSVVHWMMKIGLSRDEIHRFLSAIAAILWLGQVKFNGDETDTVAVLDASSQQALQNAARLLEIEAADLEMALLSYNELSFFNGEMIPTYKSAHPKEAHSEARSMCMLIYHDLVSWLLEKINAGMHPVGTNGIAYTTVTIIDFPTCHQSSEDDTDEKALGWKDTKGAEKLGLVQIDKHVASNGVFELTCNMVHDVMVATMSNAFLVEKKVPGGCRACCACAVCACLWMLFRIRFLCVS